MKSARTWRAKQRGIDITRLLARDGQNCTICGGALDRTVRVGRDGVQPPNLITFDHIVPRAKGGRSTQENLRLAHGVCNWTRGNDPMSEGD